MAPKKRKKRKARGGWACSNKAFFGDWREFQALVDKAEQRLRKPIEATVHVYSRDELEVFARERGVKVSTKDKEHE